MFPSPVQYISGPFQQLLQMLADYSSLLATVGRVVSYSIYGQLPLVLGYIVWLAVRAIKRSRQEAYLYFSIDQLEKAWEKSLFRPSLRHSIHKRADMICRDLLDYSRNRPWLTKAGRDTQLAEFRRTVRPFIEALSITKDDEPDIGEWVTLVNLAREQSDIETLKFIADRMPQGDWQKNVTSIIDDLKVRAIYGHSEKAS